MVRNPVLPSDADDNTDFVDDEGEVVPLRVPERTPLSAGRIAILRADIVDLCRPIRDALNR